MRPKCNIPQQIPAFYIHLCSKSLLPSNINTIKGENIEWLKECQGYMPQFFNETCKSTHSFKIVYLVQIRKYLHAFFEFLICVNIYKITQSFLHYRKKLCQLKKYVILYYLTFD